MPSTPSPSDSSPSRETSLTCTVCSDPLAEINMVIDGRPLTMRSCSQCDTRSWHRGHEAVDLGGVLADISAQPTRYRRDLTSS